MRAFSIEGIESTARKKRKRFQGPLPHSVTHTHTASLIEAFAIKGHFEMKNYMLEMLFSSLETLHVLQRCHGADFP